MADLTLPDFRTKNLGDITDNIIENNGVRQIGPPPGWVGNKPSKDCEIFVGKLPNDIFEAELIPLFEQFGKIYELRFMMKNIREHKGYVFIRYSQAEDAKKAVEHLDGFEIATAVRIAVCKSTDNRRLFISGIPAGKSENEIMEEVRKYTEEACDVTIVDFFPDHVFVSYVSPQAAVVAKRALKRQKLFNVKIKVKVAHPEIEFNDDNTLEVAPDIGDSALAGTSSSDQTPAVVVDEDGNVIICSVCGCQKQHNDHREFIKTKCGHAYCKPCSNHKFNRKNPEKPRRCDVCHQIVKGNYNKKLSGYVLFNE